MILRRNRSNQYDVAVIGGGPAGAALGTFLQRRGHSCVVVERTTFPRYHIGESLIPQTYGTLDRLGLIADLRRSHFPKKYSVRFVSETGRQSDPFYFSETIDGDAAQTWQVQRSEFDRLCLDHARRNGVEVRTDTRTDEVLFEDDRAVGLRVRPTDGDVYDIRSRVVVDASGRSKIIGTQLGLTAPVPGLRKTSIWGYYRGGKRLDGIDAGETTVFMLPQRGWFWYIPLPDDVVSVGVVASPQYLFEESKNYQTVFEQQVERCAPLRQRLVDAQRIDTIRGIPTLAYRNTQMAGDGWVMIGDAAAFLDPIYSSGLFLALASAELAADCVHEALADDDVSAERLGAYQPTLLKGVNVIRHLIHAFYDENFSFGEFARRHPHQRRALIDCLVGDVVGKDMQPFLAALAKMTPPPPPLDSQELTPLAPHVDKVEVSDEPKRPDHRGAAQD